MANSKSKQIRQRMQRRIKAKLRGVKKRALLAGSKKTGR